MGAKQPSLASQTMYLADTYPPDTNIIISENDIPGKVVGYCKSNVANRQNEMCVMVKVLSDIRVLYPNQFRTEKESN